MSAACFLLETKDTDNNTLQLQLYVDKELSYLLAEFDLAPLKKKLLKLKGKRLYLRGTEYKCFVFDAFGIKINAAWVDVPSASDRKYKYFFHQLGGSSMRSTPTKYSTWIDPVRDVTITLPLLHLGIGIYTDPRIVPYYEANNVLLSALNASRAIVSSERIRRTLLTQVEDHYVVL